MRRWFRVPNPERMPLLSALEDFVQRSLDTLPSVWEKLRFVRSLRADDASYRHWGLEEKYGAHEAHAAIAEAHSSLAEELASTPLSDLWLGVEQGASREQIELSVLLHDLETPLTIPADLRGVVPEHLQLIVRNLSRIARHQLRSSQLAA